ncbi:MAG TPA: hypothetical protein VIT88_14395 [Pyrinomonadaceae bacterium]
MACPEDFGDVFEALQRAGASYVVVGGVAAVLHGVDRPVSDVDIAVPSNPGRSNIAMRALFMNGFVPSVPLPLELVTILRLFDSSGREVDVIPRPLVPFDELEPDSIDMPVGQTLARVASLSHLIRDKERSGRPVDLEDVQRLRAIQTR